MNSWTEETDKLEIIGIQDVGIAEDVYFDDIEVCFNSTISSEEVLD